MKINNLKFLDKYFPYMPYPKRIASSARLSGIKGSEQQRNEMIEGLNNNLFKLIDDAFEKKVKKGEQPLLCGKEILKCVKKVIPKIKIKISSENVSGFDAFVENIFDKNKKTIIGYAFSIPETIKKGSNDELLRHEMHHILEEAVAPKMAARSNTENLIGRLKNYTVYKNEEHLYFYEDNLYQKMSFKNTQEEIKYLNTIIKNHFKGFKTPSEEKIEVMQTWRHLLKSELNAYTDQAKFACKEKTPDEYLKDKYGDYLFEPKIKLIEQILKDEIAGVRKISAEKYGKKSTV